jgi:hypothetical protein
MELLAQFQVSEKRTPYSAGPTFRDRRGVQAGARRQQTKDKEMMSSAALESRKEPEAKEL